MTKINYIRHTLALGVALVVLWQYPSSAPALIDRGSDPFVLMGALHAASLVIALRQHSGLAKRIVFILFASVFVVVAAILSFAVPMAGLLLASVFPFRGDAWALLVWVLGSAFGASGYWFLVRWFWLRSLKFADLPRTLMLCVAATLLWLVSAVIVSAMSGDLRDFVLYSEIPNLVRTAAWWAAFSGSLYWSEARRLRRASR